MIPSTNTATHFIYPPPPRVLTHGIHVEVRGQLGSPLPENGPGNRTQVIGVGGKCLYLLSHLADPGKQNKKKTEFVYDKFTWKLLKQTGEHFLLVLLLCSGPSAGDRGCTLVLTPPPVTLLT